MKRILIPLLLLISLTLSATTYYVSTSGNNSNNGLSTTTPWQTLQYAEAHATAAGDIIALKKGDNFASALALGITHGGSTGNPIIWDGGLWGSGANAIISSTADRPDGHVALISIAGCKNVTVQNITCNGNGYYCNGIVIGGGSDHVFGPNAVQNDEAYITIQDCSILNVGTGGDYCLSILVQTWNNDMSNITIQRNTISGSSAWGIAGYQGRALYGATPSVCHNLYVGYNTITNIGTISPSLGVAIGFTQDVWGGTIEHNTITQGTCSPSGGISLSSDEGHYPKNLIIRYNDVRMNDVPCFITQNGDAIKADIYCNLFYTNDASGGQGAVWLFISTTGYTGASLNFYNNTIVVNKGAGFEDDTSTPSVTTFINNIVINTSTSGDACIIINSGTSCTHNHNSYFRTGSGDLTYAIAGNYYYKSSALSWEPTAKITDPLLVDLAGFNWHLQPGSPAIGAGIAITGVTQDIEGLTMSNPPSMGCYQTTGSTPALTYSSSVIENATPALLQMTYNLSLANITPPASAFNVQVNSASRTVNSVAIVGGKVQLTLASAIVFGDIVTVAYTKPASNFLQTSSGVAAASISAQSVTNNCLSVSLDYVGSVVENATPTILTMTYNLSLANIIPAASAFNVLINSVSRAINSVTISGTNIQLTLASAIVYGDVVTVSYTKPGSNFIQTPSGVAAVNISAKPVTNNLASNIPVYQSSVIENASPTILTMTYSLSLANIVPASTAFNVLVNSVSRAINSVTISGNKVQLTLASAIVYGDVVTVSYTKPGSNFLQTPSGGAAVNISAKSVTNNSLSTTLDYVSSVVENATPTMLTMTYSQSMASIIPATSAFNVLVNSVSRAINSVAINGNKVQLTLASAIVYGDIVTVGYSKPGSNFLQTPSGIAAVSISAKPVTNNLASNIPIYQSSVVENASPTILMMTYSLSLASIVPASTAFNVLVNSVNRAVNSVVINGNKVQLTLSSAIVYGDVVTVTYTKPGSNFLQTPSGGAAVTISAQSVTNNSISTSPDYVSSVVENATPTILTMTYSLSMANIIPATTSFNVLVNSVSRAINSVIINENKVQLTLASAIIYGDVVTVTYSKPVSNFLQTPSGVAAVSISVKPVTNNLVSNVPVYQSSVIENASPTILTVTYGLSLANIVPSTTAFNVLVNSVSRAVNSVVINGNKVQLTLSSAIVYGNVVTVSYAKPAINFLQTPSGGAAANLSVQPVTNNCILPVPVYINSVIEDTTSNILDMTYDLILANIIPPTSAFTVKVNSIQRNVNKVTITGAKVRLTLASSVVNGDVVTVAYTMPASNPLQTSLGGKAASIGTQPVSNKTKSIVNIIAPIYVNSVVEDATPTILTMTYDLTLANLVPAATSFNVLVNSVSRAINSVVINGNKVQLTLASAVFYGNIVTVAYTKPAVNPLQTASGGQAASISARSVTNNVNNVNSANNPVYVSSVIENVTPALLEMTYDKNLNNLVLPPSSAFTVLVNSSSVPVNSVAIVGSKVQLTLSIAIDYGDIVTVAYTKPASNQLLSTLGGQAASINAQPVTNHVNQVIVITNPIYSSSVIQNASPSIVIMSYDLSLANIVPAASAFNVQVNSVNRTVNLVAIVGGKVQLTLASSVVYGNIVTVSYTKPAINPLQTASGGTAASISSKPVTNNTVLVTVNNPPFPMIDYKTSSYSGFISDIDATKSYDIDKDPLIYLWTAPDSIPISSTNSPKIQFLAPLVNESKTIEFSLSVSDGKSIQTQNIPITILPYKPELSVAKVINVEAIDYEANNYPGNIIDNNPETKWSSKGPDQWLILKLSKPFSIDNIGITFPSTQKISSYFDIYASKDTISWEPILINAISCSFSGTFQVFVFPESRTITDYSYIKLVGHGTAEDPWNNYSEFQIFGTPHTDEILINIYPNPAHQILNISIEYPENFTIGDATNSIQILRIFDISGILVLEKLVDSGVKDMQFPINLKSGIYIVQMVLNGLTTSAQKLIVIN